LGAVRDNEFIAEDEDIDIAIMREDYNRLMYHGQVLLSEKYFLQNSANDRFPLAFGKMRKNDTAFIQPVLGRVNCNKGIYIDIFPLDYEDNRRSFRVRHFLLNKRISQVLLGNGQSWKGKLVAYVSKILCVSYDKALLKREILLSSAPKSDYLNIYGGKSSEKHMPATWFEGRVFFPFRDIEVACPSGYEPYLKRIYGENYLSHNPAGNRIEGKCIEISADVLDFDNSYLDY
jgi:lipopolysaccharide cholinephosphotransferase